MTALYLDANVLFSAAHRPQDAPGLLVDFASAGLVRAFTSEYALEEARRNLALKSPDAMPSFERVRQTCALSPAPSIATLAWATTQIATKDAPILAAAVDCRCGWLVTGDRRDFGSLFGSTQRGVLVVPPSGALRRLLAHLQTGE